MVAILASWGVLAAALYPLRALPGFIAVDLQRTEDHEEPHIKIGQILLFKRVYAGLAGGRVPEPLDHIRPGHIIEQHAEDDEHDNVHKLSLEELRDHDGYLAADGGHGESSRQQCRHDGNRRGHRPPSQRDLGRKAGEVDDESCRDGRKRFRSSGCLRARRGYRQRPETFGCNASLENCAMVRALVSRNR